MNFKDLNVKQLRALCKDYNIPVNGAKNRKELLNQILIRRQWFKPLLPDELYAKIFLISDYKNILMIRLCCKKFNRIIDNAFWETKIKIDFPNAEIWFDHIMNKRFKYLKLMREENEESDSCDSYGDPQYCW